jgi:ubiquinone/menaquinone biosynthesis C-methylase UbiE
MEAPAINPVVETYSRLAREYDDDLNVRSCWGRASEQAVSSLIIKDDYRLVLDVGCGTGRALLTLASKNGGDHQFSGIDPATNMRLRACDRTKGYSHITILDGSFENIPLESGSVDYLYSVFAFHWVTDLGAAVKEVSLVLKPSGEMDLFFIGRDNGREFIQRTSPIFFKYMGPALLLQSAQMRKQLKREEALQLFHQAFDSPRVSVEESYNTYYDTLEGHWGWWVRIEGQLAKIPAVKKDLCDREVREALVGLTEEKGIPYTIHQLHVRWRRAN